LEAEIDSGRSPPRRRLRRTVDCTQAPKLKGLASVLAGRLHYANAELSALESRRGYWLCRM